MRVRRLQIAIGALVVLALFGGIILLLTWHRHQALSREVLRRDAAASSRGREGSQQDGEGQALLLPGLSGWWQEAQGLSLQLRNDHDRDLAFDEERDWVVVSSGTEGRKISIKVFFDRSPYVLPPRQKSRIVQLAEVESNENGVAVRFVHEDKWGQYCTGKVVPTGP